MNVLVTGASGLIGSALVPFLAADGCRVIPLRRASACGREPSWDPGAGRIDLDPAGPLDAVVHLAGETIAQRWTTSAKARIQRSRAGGTRLLSQALARLPRPPGVLVCASATGCYGNRPGETLDERSPRGTGFLAEVCTTWEAAAEAAVERGIRVVHLRLGMVLAAQGGALGKMLPAFRLGLGGPLGQGDQVWSWIHLGDLLRVIQCALQSTSLAGPVNAVSPGPVTNKQFTRTLATILHRPAFLPMPAFALRLILGQMADEALLGSCRAIPRKLEASGFVFHHPALHPALEDLLRGPGIG